MNLDSEADWAQILDHQPIVLNDRMMTDAVQSPHIQSEHSYSLTLSDEMPQSPFGHNIKLEDYGKGRLIDIKLTFGQIIAIQKLFCPV
ncbi:cyclic AMP response element-binding protein A [Trichonephila clavipes]|nr:cyclic AMP response element-binding protein A [Trichonephila clavipes]